MASTGRTEKLGLSLWEATDRPERMDFRQDNEQLEELVGAHLEDVAAHVPEAQRAFLSNPIYCTTYNGNGASSASKSNYSDFPAGAPRLMIVFATDKPPVQYVDGRVKLYFAMASMVNGYHTPGLTLQNGRFTVSQQSDADAANGCQYCLNERNQTYCVFMLQ